MKKQKKDISRRDFIKFASTALASLPGLVSVTSCSDKGAFSTYEETIPKRTLGNTGLEVSMLSFGGGSQFLKNPDGKWEPLLQRAINLGINYFDTSSNYGTEERYGELLSPIRDQVIIATKFDSRSVEGMKNEFEGSLNCLKTDYVDILMIHSITDNDDVDIIAQGVYKEMLRLKQEGTVRFIGFSSMNSAQRSKELIEKLDFDVALLAINAIRYGDFDDLALPSAVKKNMGVIAMKVMKDVVGQWATAEELLRYTLDQDGVCSALIGHYGMGILEENVELVKSFVTTTGIACENRRLEKRLRPLADPYVLRWARPDYVDGQLV